MKSQTLHRLAYFGVHPHAALFRVFRGRGLPGPLRRAMGFPRGEALQGELLELVDAHADRATVLFPLPGSPWGYLFQRPQQLATALARAGCLVLYAVEPDPRFDVDYAVRGLRRIEDRLYLFADGAGGATLASVAKRLWVWQYWPHQSPMIERHLRSARLAYDCIDDVSLFRAARGRGADWHTQALRRAEHVFATSDALVEAARAQRPDVIHLPNACDYDHFRAGRPAAALPSLYDETEGRAARVIGFHGAIAPWVDTELILEVAAARPMYRFMLVGEDQVGFRARAARAVNVEVVEAVPYAKLPAIVARFDVGTIPFRDNAVTRGANPVKLFEYFAAGKPVVARNLPEMLRYPTVLTADTVEDFAGAIDRAMVLTQDPDYLARVDRVARDNTWSARAAVILAALGSGNA